MIVAHSLYRCNECREEQMVSNEDSLKSKLDGWLTVKIHVFGGAVEEQAWSEGYGVGKGDGMKGVKTGRMFQNPYRVTPTRDEAIDAASRKDPLEE